MGGGKGGGYRVGHRVELECTKPGKREGRTYALAIELDRQAVLPYPNVLAFATYALVITKGHVRGRRSTRRESFGSLERLGARFDALYRRRMNHGYELVRVGVA